MSIYCCEDKLLVYKKRLKDLWESFKSEPNYTLACSLLSHLLNYAILYKSPGNRNLSFSDFKLLKNTKQWYSLCDDLLLCLTEMKFEANPLDITVCVNRVCENKEFAKLVKELFDTEVYNTTQAYIKYLKLPEPYNPRDALLQYLSLLDTIHVKAVGSDFSTLTSYGVGGNVYVRVTHESDIDKDVQNRISEIYNVDPRIKPGSKLYTKVSIVTRELPNHKVKDSVRFLQDWF